MVLSSSTAKPDLGSISNGVETNARHNSTSYSFGTDGFEISPGPLLDASTAANLRDRAERVLSGQYETGRPPRTNSGGVDVANHPSYIEASFPQDSDRLIANFIRDTRVAAWVAKATGAKRLQVWNTMVIKKYPTGSPKTVVGWHQDQRYLQKIINGMSINCWIALDEVSSDTGPMRFVPGSHAWERMYATGFFEQDVNKQREEIEVPEGKKWTEVESTLPAGWASVHHPMLLHGSGPCYGSKPRYNILINYAADDFQMLPGHYFAERINDPEACPVVYLA